MCPELGRKDTVVCRRAAAAEHVPRNAHVRVFQPGLFLNLLLRSAMVAVVYARLADADCARSFFFILASLTLSKQPSATATNREVPAAFGYASGTA